MKFISFILIGMLYSCGPRLKNPDWVHLKNPDWVYYYDSVTKEAVPLEKNAISVKLEEIHPDRLPISLHTHILNGAASACRLPRQHPFCFLFRPEKVAWMLYNLYKVHRRGNTRYAHWCDGPPNSMPDSVPDGEPDVIRATNIGVPNGLYEITPPEPLAPGDYVFIVTNWEVESKRPDSTTCFSFTVN